MKKILLAAAVIATLGVQPAFADEGPLLVRVRALHLDSANKDGTGLGLSINNKTFPEVDFSYFFAPNVAAELILTYPQKQRLYSNGAEIGSLKHLPPTLTLQYHFNPTGTVRPYVGAGMNYTNFSSVEFAPAVQAALHPSIKRNSWGAAWQVGADVEIAKGTYLNFDLKKVDLQTTVYSSGASVGKFKVNPTLASIGIGWEGPHRRGQWRASPSDAPAMPVRRVLFFCMGNICRSPTAEGVMRAKLAAAGLDVEVDSAGTHGYHVGDPPDERSQVHARKRGYDLSVLRARQLEAADFARFDLVLAMDEANLVQARRLCPPDQGHRLRRLMDYAPKAHGRIVPDPYYGEAEDFEHVLDLVEVACDGLVASIKNQ